MGKARCLLRGQYAAVASCLDRLREQVQQEFREEAEVEQRIQQCLKKNGILCEWLQVRSDRSEERPGQEIRMTLAFRTEMPEARERRCRELLGECLGIPVRRLEKRRERGRKLDLRLSGRKPDQCRLLRSEPGGRRYQRRQLSDRSAG